MSVVGVVESLAWLISIGLGGWMLVDMTRVARGHDEATLIDSSEDLDHEPAGLTGTEPRS